MSIGAAPKVATGTAYKDFFALHSRILLERDVAPPLDTFSLIDTGASLSLVARDKLTDAQLASAHSGQLTIKGIGATKSSGFVVLPFVIPGLDADDNPVELHFTHEFWVVDELPPGVVLGTDWMHPHNVAVNIASTTATLANGLSFPVFVTPRPAPPVPANTAVESYRADAGPVRKTTELPPDGPAARTWATSAEGGAPAADRPEADGTAPSPPPSSNPGPATQFDDNDTQLFA